jgi:hypothetical protein
MPINLSEYQSLAAADEHSAETLDRLRVALVTVPRVIGKYMDVIAVGSYGRGEAAKDLSDFEWITIYDDRYVAREEAVVAQADLTVTFANEFGRERLSINKTFGEVAERSALLTNVGGEADTNQTLTYRMLTLAEGRALTDEAHAGVIAGLAGTYGGTHTAGHRLLSLATEIARYWRTLRIDYKYKVDESRKPWALRSMKLRSFRRFWYFSSALHFLAFGPRVNPPSRLESAAVEAFMKTMGGNPAVRFIRAGEKLGVAEQLMRRVLTIYDDIHRRSADPSVREVLNKLSAEKMEEERVFVDIRELTREYTTLWRR